MSQLNLPHGTNNQKVENRNNKKRICSEVSVNSPGNPWSQSGRSKGRLRWEGFAEKEGFIPRKDRESEGVMDDANLLTSRLPEIRLQVLCLQLSFLTHSVYAYHRGKL